MKASTSKTRKTAAKKSNMKSIFIQTMIGSYQVQLTDRCKDMTNEELSELFNSSEMSLFRPSSKGYQSPIFTDSNGIIGFLGWPNIYKTANIPEKLSFVKSLIELFNDVKPHHISEVESK